MDSGFLLIAALGNYTKRGIAAGLPEAATACYKRRVQAFSWLHVYKQVSTVIGLEPSLGLKHHRPTIRANLMSNHIFI